MATPTATSEPSSDGEGESAGAELAPRDDAVLRFVERFALMLADVGMPRMAARAFACLLTDDSGQLTAGELADRLRVSPAAISTAVRYLVQLRMVRREREPGERSDRYRVDSDIWYETYMQRATELRRWEEELADGIALLGIERPAGRRLAETQEFFAFLRAELPRTMERWREHKQSQAG